MTRLHLGFLEKDLGDRFNVTQQEVSEIFSTWVDWMFDCLGQLSFSTDRESIKRRLSECFKPDYEDVYLIIDCIELLIEKPSQVIQQSAQSRREWSGEQNLRCNNRYLSRIEILDKLIEEKRSRINCEKLIGRLSPKMVEMASEDQADLVQMMCSIPGKEVRDDLKVLWKQQQKIASTASGRGYHWHPK